MNLNLDPRTTQSANLSPQIPDPASARNLKQLRESAREMEALYINEMYKTMRKSIPEDGLIEQSSTSKTFQEMLDMEMARKAAAGDGMGIGEAMYNQLRDKIK